jgi:hypothetical protein
MGVYYFQQDSDDIATIDLNPPPPGIQHDSDNNEVDNSSWAVFTQWTYDINDRLSVTAGGRYTEETKRSFPDQFDYANPAVKQVPVRWYSDTFSDFTPSASSWISQTIRCVSTARSSRPTTPTCSVRCAFEPIFALRRIHRGACAELP